MWTTVHVAENKEDALKIKNKLSKIGFLIKTNFYTREGNNELYEIMVPEFEVEDVEKAMIELEII